MRFAIAALVAASCGTATPPAKRPTTPPPSARPEPPSDEEGKHSPHQRTSSDQSEATESIKATLDAFTDAVARRDADAIVALHVDSPDTIAVWPGVGEELFGIDAIRTALRQELATWESATFVITDSSIRLLGPKLAFVWGHYDQDMRARPPGTRRAISRRVRGARFFTVMKRHESGWKMLIEAGSIPMTATMWETLADPPPYDLRPRAR